ncbi:MAG: carbohydrate ABC transporter permease, partial [Ignavibacteria bacterium]|nr:carbohydrate ABC transporter permease [Ignavibacteria bacterium]
IFTFIGTWGDFLWPLIVLKNQENYTLQVGLSYMMGTFVNNYRYVAAGAVLAIIPVIFLFIFSQKYFEKGIFAGSGK